MIINHECLNGRLELKFTPEKDDPIINHIFNSTYKTTRKVKMGSNRCEVHLPSDWTIDAVHPDVYALAIIAAVYPFCGPNIHLPRGVSKHFQNLDMRLTNKRVIPIIEKLTPRKAPTNAIPALTYSGGFDSTAAAVLLPSNTHLFYFDRLIPKGI